MPPYELLLEPACFPTCTPIFGIACSARLARFPLEIAKLPGAKEECGVCDRVELLKKEPERDRVSERARRGSAAAILSGVCVSSLVLPKRPRPSRRCCCRRFSPSTLPPRPLYNPHPSSSLVVVVRSRKRPWPSCSPSFLNDYYLIPSQSLNPVPTPPNPISIHTQRGRLKEETPNTFATTPPDLDRDNLQHPYKTSYPTAFLPPGHGIH